MQNIDNGIWNVENDAEWAGILRNGKTAEITSLIEILLCFCPAEHMDLITLIDP